MEKILKIVSVGDIQTATSGRKFRKITYKGVKFLGTLQVVSNQQPVSRLAWSDFKDSEGREFKSDPIYNDIFTGEIGVGGAVEGELMSFSTSPYVINGKTVTVYTMPIFSNEYNKADAVANNALKSNKASTVSEDGIVLAPANLEVNSMVN